MARLARIVIPGLAHHITQRGNRRQTVFFGDQDYRAYLDLLGEWSATGGLNIWAYCLMPNHVHLIGVPKTEDSLRAAVAETHRRYTRLINFREGWRGHLWQERFHSFALDEAYLYRAVRYVELNPVRAGLVKRARDWRWSSVRGHLKGAHLGSGNDPLLAPSDQLKDFGNWAAYLNESARDTESEKDAIDQLRLHSRTGRPLGDAKFIKRMERKTGRELIPRKPGPKRKA